MELIAALAGGIIGALIAGGFSWLATSQVLESERMLRKEEAEKEIKAVLSAMYHELKTVWNLYMQGTGKMMEETQASTGFPWTVPMTENYYVVYDSNARHIGLIPDPVLRDKIITAYTYAKALKDSYLLNNKLNDETVEAQDRMNTDRRSGPLASIFTDKQKGLIKYGHTLRDAHEKTKAAAIDAINALESYSTK